MRSVTLMERSMRSLLLGILVACSFASTSWATEYGIPLALDGTTLRTLCASSSETHRAMCRGYILGVIGGVRHARPGTTQCFLTGLTNLYDTQVVDTVSVYLSQMRQAPENDAAISTISALMRAHPCL
jgi:hypothetical protein